jgi:hypothetical protein
MRTIGRTGTAVHPSGLLLDEELQAARATSPSTWLADRATASAFPIRCEPRPKSFKISPEVRLGFSERFDHAE